MFCVNFRCVNRTLSILKQTMLLGSPLYSVTYDTNDRFGLSARIYKRNVVAYAYDILLLSPSAKGLQMMIDKITFPLQKLCLLANKDKSRYIVFSSRENVKIQWTLSLMGVPLNKVSELEHLGVFLTKDLELTNNSNRALNNFFTSIQWNVS